MTFVIILGALVYATLLPLPATGVTVHAVGVVVRVDERQRAGVWFANIPKVGEGINTYGKRV